MTSGTTYYGATGRRKCAVARVRLLAGKGTISVNDKPCEELFPRLEHRQAILKPFLVSGTRDNFGAVVKVKGGGISGQAGAICHGIARALVKADERFRPLLRKEGLLTRDPRVKERKKYGLKRARKAPQYTKR